MKIAEPPATPTEPFFKAARPYKPRCMQPILGITYAWMLACESSYNILLMANTRSCSCNPGLLVPFVPRTIVCPAVVRDGELTKHMRHLNLHVRVQTWRGIAMASVPLQVQIFESLVPQVANQATSLERVLRVLCQKIETLEACINSINVGVVEMDSRLKTIAHNIEGGNEAFNAKSTFIPTLPTEKLRSDDNSAVVSHVMNALIMGHFRPLEKLKKKKKKHHDHKNDDVDVASVPDQGPRSA
ncbi:hypothetical protein As57867_002338, partial [Aphanomyces stellatus]